MEQLRMTMLCLALVALSQVEAHSVLGHLSSKASSAEAFAEAFEAFAEAKASAPVLAAKVNIKSEVPVKGKAASPAESSSTAPKFLVSADHAHDRQAVVKKSPSVVRTMLATSEAHSHAKAASALNIKPDLKDVASDKKFFGPPFPADYPDDKRPVIDKSILNKLKGPDQPYPALQSKADFDRDFVKDENSDTGSWKAQMEYDTLRQKLAKEQADEKRAEREAAKEARDAAAAQAKADAAAKDSANEKKGADDAEAGDAKDASKGDSGKAMPSSEEVEKLKKKVAEAASNYGKEKKEFEECEKQLQDAKKQLEDLKAKQAEMEKSFAAETKLWIENKSVRSNLKKTKQDAAVTKHKDAETRVAAAEKNKIEADERLAIHKFQSEQAQNSLRKQKAQMEQARQNLEKATLTLRKIRGYTPAEAAPVKSGAPAASVAVTILSMLTMVAMNIFRGQ